MVLPLHHVHLIRAPVVDDPTPCRYPPDAYGSSRLSWWTEMSLMSNEIFNLVNSIVGAGVFDIVAALASSNGEVVVHVCLEN